VRHLRDAVAVTLGVVGGVLLYAAYRVGNGR